MKKQLIRNYLPLNLWTSSKPSRTRILESADVIMTFEELPETNYLRNFIQFNKNETKEADCLPALHLEEGRTRTRVCWLRASSTSQQPARAPAFIQFNKAALSQLWCSMIHITTYVYSK